jgi:hypothetical protein
MTSPLDELSQAQGTATFEVPRPADWFVSLWPVQDDAIRDLSSTA